MIGTFIMVIAILGSQACTRIDVGHVGLKVNMASGQRGVENTPTVTGWVFYNPLTQSVIEYPVNIQSITWTKDLNEGSPTDESITFSSKEGLIIDADIGFAYNIEGTKAPKLYSKFRQDDLDILAHGYIRNIIRDSLNEVASTMAVQDIYGTKKSELLLRAKERARSMLASDGIVVDQLNFATSLRLPPDVEKAINNSIAQTQRAHSAENKVAEIKAKADQKIAEAKGVAESLLIRARADAEALLTRGKADVEFNQMLQKTITPELMRYKLMSRWDGKLPQFTGSGVTPMINVSDLANK